MGYVKLDGDEEKALKKFVAKKERVEKAIEKVEEAILVVQGIL